MCRISVKLTEINTKQIKIFLTVVASRQDRRAGVGGGGG